MKKILKIGSFKLNLKFLIIIFVANLMSFQTHAQDVVVPDSTNSVSQEMPEVKEKKKKDKKDSFKVFGGVNFNLLSMDQELIQPTMAAGWLLGASYKRGHFFYWEVGATLNNSIYNLTDTILTSANALDGVFGVKNIDVPLTVGVNFLTAVDRIVGLRGYVSAIPSFNIGVGSNDLGIKKDIINDFNLYGRAGVGVDVAFLFIEAGYSYGFEDLFKNDIKSNPNQIFINLGVRL